MTRLALAALTLLLALPGRAGQLPTGDFLNMPVDVRALGMGEASQAVASGISEVSMNPAAVNGTKAQHFYVTHAFMYAGVGVDYLAYSLAAGNHKFGLTYHHVGYGSLEGHDTTGVETGNYGPSDNAYGLTYGTQQGDLSLGLTGKIVESKIVSTARTTAFDLGAQYKLGEEWLLGASVHNMAGRLKYDAVSAPLPARVAAGVGWRAAEGWWLALDAVHPLYTPSYIAIGTAYSMPIKGVGALALRLGLNTKTPDLGVAAGLKAGFGLRFQSLDIDYAFNAAGAIGDTHHIGLGYRFGGAKSE